MRAGVIIVTGNRPEALARLDVFVGDGHRIIEVNGVDLCVDTAGDAELPPMSEELRAYFAAEVPLPDWAERTAVIDYIVGYERRLEAAEYFDEAHVRALVERIVDRTDDMAASVMNYALAEEGDLVRGRLDEIAAPTLVSHGTSDPLFPYGHAEALARGIPRAKLLPLEGVGHQMPPRSWWTPVIAAMLRHTSG